MTDKPVYLDHAATTPLRREVLDAMMPYLTSEFGNPSSASPLGRHAKEAVAQAREAIAALIGAEPSEVFFTSSGTEADNWALKGFARANRDKGRHIITDAIEHHAIFRSCEALEREGFEVTTLPVGPDGLVSPADFEAAIREDTILASVMLANNEIGVVEPVAELARIAHDHGVAFHTDAVQAFGHIPIDVDELGVDMLSSSAHKLGGPKGTGLLYIRKGTKVENLMDGGGQEAGCRPSTENVAGIVGYARAAGLAWAEMDSEMARQSGLRDYCIARILQDVPGSSLNGSRASRLPNNANISFAGVQGSKVVEELAERGFYTSAGSACTSGCATPSHVLTAIGLAPEDAVGSVRITVGESTTQDDIDAVVAALAQIVPALRG